MVNLRVAMILFCLLASGCANIKERARDVTFDQTAREYRLAIRWGDYDRAAAFIKPGKDRTPPDPSALKDVRVTGYTEKRQKMEMGERPTIKSVVEIHYYRDANPVERSISETQIWEYDPEISKWFLLSGLPKFK